MTITPTYTGDIFLSINEFGDWDLNYINGQPEMTDSFDTGLILSVFGEPDFWQNDITTVDAEKYISEFPAIIKNGRVDDDTLKAGTAAIKKAVQWMIDINAAERIDVVGGVLNVFGLYWQVDITRGEIVSKYTINWDKGVLNIDGLQLFDIPFNPSLFHSAMINPDLTIQTNPSGEVQLYEFT